MNETIPSHAQVVVIGAGVVGASVACRLAALGCRDVVLLERAKIGSGTSWHPAGNMETYRADPLIGEMIRYAVDFYPRLEAETGQALGWRQTGRVMFTADAERLPLYRGLPALGRARGIEIEYLTPARWWRSCRSPVRRESWAAYGSPATGVSTRPILPWRLPVARGCRAPASSRIRL